MELYVLDALLRRVAVIDRFESLIWTERHKLMGDFELHIHSDQSIRKLLPAGTLLAVNESTRVMIVETIEKTTDTEGREMLIYKGPSLEKILEDRVARNLGGGLDNPTWFIPGTPGAVAREIFQTVCVDNLPPYVGSTIPFIVWGQGSIYPSNTIPEPLEIIEVSIQADTVYKLITDICESYGLGFRLVRNLDTSQLYFDIYTGNDVTSNQTYYKPVIFSESLDNLEDTTDLTSISDVKNVCQVFTKTDSLEVYDIGVDPTISGFERKVMILKAEGLDNVTGTKLTAMMRQQGLEALAKQRGLAAFDGKVPERGSYKYGVDYQLGDLVEMRSADGLTNYMRVTEQIMISDAEGDRSYPTLTVDYSIEPGTWLAWDYNQTWDIATKTWAEA